jgi:hypothetical protein
MESKHLIRILKSLVLASIMAACAPKSPWINGSPPKENVFEKHFELAPSEVTLTQQKYDENTVSVYFRVLKDGRSVESVKETDLRVQENGITVNPFALSAETERTQQVADIVFLVDITGTMVELIESAKKRLAEFVKTSRERGFHTRMCIATFGDYTVKKCSRFFDNNPADKSTEAQVKELLSELSTLRAFRGNGKDPGWPDLDENPMGALVDASQAPWGQDSQRFVILVTDWGFLYSPDNQGTIGDKAPTMKQVTDAIKTSQMKVFAVTRTKHTHKGKELVWDGYNTPFQGEPGIVQSSDGEYFDFDKVLSGEVSLDHVLERILDRLNTLYKLSYVVDHVPGLAANLPIEKRKVKVALENANQGEVFVNSILSSMPKGRPEYQNRWKVADEPIQPESVKVFVNNRELGAGEVAVQNQEVVFNEVPAPGSSIRFVFLYQRFEKHLRMEPLLFSQPIDGAKLRVMFNDIEANSTDFVLANDLEGRSSLTLSETALAPQDPYGIRKNRGLTLKVYVNCGGQVKDGHLQAKEINNTQCVVPNP